MATETTARLEKSPSIFHGIALFNLRKKLSCIGNKRVLEGYETDKDQRSQNQRRQTNQPDTNYSFLFHILYSFEPLIFNETLGLI